MLAATAFAGWDRSVRTEKASFKDSPPPHPLAYFKTDPCIRPSTDRLVGSVDQCLSFPAAFPPDAAELARRANTTTDLVEVGKIGDFTIYDLWYSMGAYGTGRELRSVLVKTGPDEYREIDVSFCRIVFPESEIVDLDGEKMLIVIFHDGGQHSSYMKTPYVFGPEGIKEPDFSAVEKAIGNLMPPKNMSVALWTDDYAAMKVAVLFNRNDTNQPRMFVQDWGCITVTYHFFEGHAVVTGSNYEPFACPR